MMIPPRFRYSVRRPRTFVAIATARLANDEQCASVTLVRNADHPHGGALTTCTNPSDAETRLREYLRDFARCHTRLGWRKAPAMASSGTGDQPPAYTTHLARRTAATPVPATGLDLAPAARTRLGGALSAPTMCGPSTSNSTSPPFCAASGFPTSSTSSPDRPRERLGEVQSRHPPATGEADDRADGRQRRSGHQMHQRRGLPRDRFHRAPARDLRGDRSPTTVGGSPRHLREPLGNRSQRASPGFCRSRCMPANG